MWNFILCGSLLVILVGGSGPCHERGEIARCTCVFPGTILVVENVNVKRLMVYDNCCTVRYNKNSKSPPKVTHLLRKVNQNNLITCRSNEDEEEKRKRGLNEDGKKRKMESSKHDKGTNTIMTAQAGNKIRGLDGKEIKILEQVKKIVDDKVDNMETVIKYQETSS
ncbi:unnamed protein product [Mytilus coruscus]|uniref:Uncharacterized protein n=1 Tax=Mytilus coruscus TaxID=42192 RepID=A0A6J8AQW6_MYTCO|nr:unnamed protein product [Mytilus coruscus]